MTAVPEKSRAVVLLSGGMDSCVCAALAARDYEAAAVHVSYGQRTEERERQSFLAICRASEDSGPADGSQRGIARRLAGRH